MPDVLDEQAIRERARKALAPKPQPLDKDTHEIRKRAEAALMKSRSIPPSPVNLMPPQRYQVQPAAVATPEDFDRFEETAKTLYLSRGLEIPTGDVKIEDFNKWTRNYVARLEGQEPFTAKVLRDAHEAKDKATVEGFKKHLEAIYLIQRAPPGEKDKQAALRDAWKDWTAGSLVDGRGQPGKLPEGVSRADPQDVQALYWKYKALQVHRRPQNERARLAEFSPEEKALFEAIDGDNFFAYYDRREPFYVGRNRLETLTGQALGRDKPPTITRNQYRELYPGPLAVRRWLDQDYDPRLREEFPQDQSTVPREADFHHLHLAPAFPWLAQLQGRADQEAQKAQIEERARFALEKSAYKPPGGFFGGQNIMGGMGSMPEAGALFSKGPPVSPDAARKANEEAYKAIAVSGQVLNLATLGVFEALYHGIQATAEAPFVLTGNPDAYNAYVASFPATVYKALVNKFDPKGSDALARWDAHWRDAFPLETAALDRIDSNARLSASRATENALARLADPKSHPNAAAILGALGLSDAPARDFVSNLVGTVVEDGTGLLMAGLGSGTLWRMVRGKHPLPDLKQPFQRFSEVEKHLAQEGAFSPIPAAERSELLEVVTRELGKVTDLKPAQEVLKRLHQEVQARGPLDPQITASAITKIRETEDRLKSMQGLRLSQDAKRALAGLAEPIATLGITDAMLVTTGKVVHVNAKESARVAENLKALLDRMEVFPDQPISEMVKTLEPKRYLDIVHSLKKQQSTRQDLLRRRGQILNVVDKVMAPLPEELGLLRQTTTHKEIGRDAVRGNWNDQIRGTFEKWRRLEFEGGEKTRPNQNLYREAYQKFYALRKTGSFTLDDLLKDPKLFQTVAGPEGPELLKRLKRGGGKFDPDWKAAHDRTIRLVDEWLNENARPEVVAVPKAEKPRVGMANSIERKIEKTKRGQLIELTPEEMAVLNTARETPMGKIQDTRSLLAAYDRDIGNARKLSKEREAFLGELQGFRDRVNNLDPQKPWQKIPLAPAVLKLLEDELDSPAWAVRGERFISIVDGYSDKDLSGLQAFREATSALDADAKLLREAEEGFSSLDFAVASALSPRTAIWMQRWHLQNAKGYENLQRARVAEVMKKFDVTPEKAQGIVTAWSEGRSDIPEVAKLMQDHQADLLKDEYRSGLITAEQYAERSGNRFYYHGKFDHSDTVNAPGLGAMIPGKFRQLRVDPSNLHGKIPEVSWYAAWKEGDKNRVYPSFTAEHKADGSPVFKGPDEVRDWLERNVSEGSEVSVMAPFTLGQKLKDGLIGEAGTSYIDYVRNTSQNIATAMINRSLSKSAFVADEARALQMAAEAFTHGQGFRDHNGNKWFFIEDQKATHLTGKYVSEQAVQWLQLMRGEFGWWKVFVEKLGIDVKNNDLIPTVARWAEHYIGRSKVTGGVARAFGAMQHLFGISAVGLNPTMFAAQFISNYLWNAPAAGFPMFTPYGHFKFSKYAAVAIRKWKSVLDDEGWRDLASKNLISTSPEKIDRLQVDAFEKNWKSVAGFEARIQTLESQIQKHAHDPVGNAKILNDLTDGKLALEKQLRDAQLKASSGFVGGIVSAFSKTKNALADTFLRPGSRIGEKIFNFVGLWDDLFKRVVYEYYRKDRGMSRESALEHIEAFMQNLNRVPEPVALLGQRLGGSKFTTYPFNLMQVLGNVAKHRKAFVGKYLAGLFGWNYAMVAASGRDPMESAEKYAFMNGYGKGNWSTTALFWLGQIHLPDGGSIPNPMFQIFSAKYGPAARAYELVAKTDLDPALKVVAEAIAGTTGRLFLGGPGLNLFGQLVTGRGQRGESFDGPLDFLKSIFQTLVPDLTPGDRLFNEIWDWATTEHVSPVTGEKKDFSDYILRRAVGYMSPQATNSHVGLRVAMHAHLSKDPKRARIMQAAALQEDVNDLIFAKGAQDDPEMARKVTKEFFSNPENLKHFVGPDFSIPETLGTVDHIDKASQASVPSTLRGFQGNLSLVDQIHVYGLWRRYWKNQIDPELHRKVTAAMLKKAFNAHPDFASEVKTAREVVNAWEKDESLPEDAKRFLRTLHGLSASQGTVQMPAMPPVR